MTHDPLCPRSQPPNDHPWGCCCELIRTVREDEHRNVLVKDGSPGWRFQQTGYRAGYAAALRDAVEAVNVISEDYDGDEWEQGRMALRVAVAAIEALGGER